MGAVFPRCCGELKTATGKARVNVVTVGELRSPSWLELVVTAGEVVNL
jgi:hypothetical protein